MNFECYLQAARSASTIAAARCPNRRAACPMIAPLARRPLRRVATSSSSRAAHALAAAVSATACISSAARRSARSRSRSTSARVRASTASSRAISALKASSLRPRSSPWRHRSGPPRDPFAGGACSKARRNRRSPGPCRRRNASAATGGVAPANARPLGRYRGGHRDRHTSTTQRTSTLLLERTGKAFRANDGWTIAARLGCVG